MTGRAATGVEGGRESDLGFHAELQEPGWLLIAKGEAQARATRKARAMQETGADRPVSALRAL